MFVFRLDYGFLLSDAISAEVSIQECIKISESDILERFQETQISQAILEGFPKKCVRKSKKEQEKWLQEQAEREAALPIFEKTIEALLITL